MVGTHRNELMLFYTLLELALITTLAVSNCVAADFALRVTLVIAFGLASVKVLRPLLKVAIRRSGFDHPQSAMLGFMMNTRGRMGPADYRCGRSGVRVQPPQRRARRRGAGRRHRCDGCGAAFGGRGLLIRLRIGRPVLKGAL
jgi:hypothetical protein